MTPNQQVLSDEQVSAAWTVGTDGDAYIDPLLMRFARAIESATLAALAQQAQEPVDELIEFEASMRENHGWVARDFQSDSFGYFDGHTATAWLAWQARAALQSPAPQTKGGEA